jgi:CheY-like chemotaxis protein
MTQPLALVLYERLLPGTQLVNRLQDLKYRVQTVSEASRLVECAQQLRPMLVLADLAPSHTRVCAAIQQLKTNSATAHLPVIAFSADNGSEPHIAAQKAGVTIIATETALLNHLPQLLEQALQVD